jgi:methionyl-tRNA formyltransferase
MKLVILTNDNFFSFTVLEHFLKHKKNDIDLIIFSSALIGKKRSSESIKWALQNTGFRHTMFKLLVYGIFRFLKLLCSIVPFIPNHYSSFLWAKRNGLKTLTTSNVNSPEIVAQLKAINPDLIISVSMNQIVKKDILEMPSKRCINVHCAPLPRYGGMSPYVWALANNEDHSAATIHYMEEGLDVGDIIVQEKISVVQRDSAFALFYRCCKRASELLVKVVNDIEFGTTASYPQDLSQKTYFSWPTKECVRNLHANGFKLATTKDFLYAIFKQMPRFSLGN